MLWITKKNKPIASTVWKRFLEASLVRKLQDANTKAPGRLRFGWVTVRGWNGSSGSGFRFRRFLCKTGFSLFSVQFNRKGRFRFRFRFLKNGSGGSGSAFGFGKNGSDGSGSQFPVRFLSHLEARGSAIVWEFDTVIRDFWQRLHWGQKEANRVEKEAKLAQVKRGEGAKENPQIKKG